MTETSHATLYYFNTQDDTEASVAIEMTEIIKITTYAQSSTKPYGFKLVLTSGKKYILTCSSEEDQTVIYLIFITGK